MFSILTDKLVLTAIVKELDPTTINRYKKALNLIGADYFEDYAFKARKNYIYLNVDMFPTYYGHVDHNLEQPTEDELLELLKRIRMACPHANFYTSEIHLTKDEVVYADPLLYIKTLANLIKRYKPIIFEKIARITTKGTNGERESIIGKYWNIDLTNLKKNTEEKDFKVTKLLKAYNKKAQLLAYDKDLDTLYFRHHLPVKLSEVENLLRLEYVFKGKSNTTSLIPFEEIRSFSLTLDSLISLLEKKKLYDCLDEVFSNYVSNLISVKSVRSEKTLCKKLQALDFGKLMPIGYLNELSALLGEMQEDKQVIEECATNTSSQSLIEELLNKFCPNAVLISCRGSEREEEETFVKSLFAIDNTL